MMNIDEICSYRVDCCGCPKENNCLFLEKKAKDKAKLLESDNKSSTLTNKEWVDLLQRNFNVSRTVAKEMLHILMTIKIIRKKVNND